jgi:DNA topoisomerase-1
MRTDSTRVSDAALTEVRDFIGGQYGANYLPEKAVHYRSKRMRRTRTKRFARRMFRARPIRSRNF